MTWAGNSQIVWREPDHGYGYRTYLAQGDPYFMSEGLEPGVWHSLDPKALAEIRDVLRVALALGKLTSPDAVMAALGLTPPES